MSARARRVSARQKPEKAQQYNSNSLNFDGNAIRISSDELLNLNSRYSGGSADLP
jgi:hypothetical protein